MSTNTGTRKGGKVDWEKRGRRKKREKTNEKDRYKFEIFVVDFGSNIFGKHRLISIIA